MMTDCNNPKHGQFNSMDRLSDLPDLIIHQIISYLGKKEAYRTSVLSKRWNQIFTTNPILDFSHCKFSNETASRDLEYIDTRMQKFSKENLRITKFKLALPDTDLLLACKVDEWLEIAVRNQVTEIVLEGRADYKLPRILFCAKSLRSLDCDNVEIPYYEYVDLVSLEFFLLRNNIVFEERMLFHIVSSCLNLKDLRISFCPGFKNLVIPRHSKLEFLYIEGDVPVDGGKVILETSSLTTFDYNINSVNGPWPIISNRGLLRNLRHLLVTGLSITGKDLAKLLPELTSLEKLKFLGCQKLKNIKISHTQLKDINFSDCYYLLNLVINAPNLKKFEFHGKINRPLSITIHSQASCTIHVRTKACYFDTDGFFILKKLLKGLNSCNVLKIMLQDDDDEGGGGGEEEGHAELGPPCDIGKLKLNLSYWEFSSSSLSAFLNGLFGTCHPPLISLRVESGHYKMKVEPLLNKLEDMVKCLEHPLKRIEVEETTTSDCNFLDVQLRLCW